MVWFNYITAFKSNRSASPCLSFRPTLLSRRASDETRHVCQLRRRSDLHEAVSDAALGMNEHVTLMHPDARDPTARAISSGFPLDLLSQSAGRLRVLALLYAFVFFMAGIFPALLFKDERARFLGSFLQWGPGVIAIVVALLVAAVIRSARLPLPTAMNIGLVFEIASSYAIAAAEFADPMGLEMHNGMIGLSWVAVWIVLFTVVVPTPPRRAVLAALASVSSVPVVIGLMIASGITSFRLDPAQFFFGLVFPYLLVVGMAYVGARVVYQLGTEVKRARELGSYRLEEKLGEGGMGEVWRARHRMLARPAAIKLIRPAFGGDGRAGVSEEAVRRFEREAQVIARLRSPHTVELFRFRDRRRRRLLLCHGAAGRPRCRLATPPLRANPARTGHLPASPGLSLAVR